MVGLIGNEFIAKYTPGRGVFDWNDILWTLIGGSLFILVNKLVEKRIKTVTKLSHTHFFNSAYCVLEPFIIELLVG